MKKIVIIIFIIAIRLNSIIELDSLRTALFHSSSADSIEILQKISEIMHENNEFDQTIRIEKKKLSIAHRLQKRELEYDILNIIGVLFEQSGQIDSSFVYYNKALQYSLDNKIKKNSASYLNLAYYYLNNLQYAESLENIQICIKKSKETKDTFFLIESYNFEGRVNNELMNYESALESYLKGLKIALRLGDEKILSRCYNHIGSVYHSMSNEDKALEYFQKALEISIKHNEIEGIAIFTNNIGLVYKSLKQFDKAIQYFKKSARKEKERKNPLGMIDSNLNICSSYIEKNDYTSASKLLDTILKMADKNSNLDVLSQIYNLKGDIYLHQKRYQNAEKYYKKSYEIAKTIKSSNYLLDSYSSLKGLYFAKKEYKKAFDFLSKYSTLKDSIYRNEDQEKINKLNIRIATENKEHQIEMMQKEKKLQEITISREKSQKNMIILLFFVLLFISFLIYSKYKDKNKMNKKLVLAYDNIEKNKKELEIINKKQEKLLAELHILNSTKDKFFSIISHDLKNAVASLISGSRLLSVHIDSLDRESIARLGIELKTSVQHLYKLMENLLTWARTQSKHYEFKQSYLNLKAIFSDIEQVLKGSLIKKTISLNIDIEENVILYADKNMIFSVLMNIINNAIKFSHPNSKIDIIAKKDDNFVLIKVKDYGIGISAQNIGKLFKIDNHFKRDGTENEKGTGLGLIICHDFINKNNGEIFVESEENKGTTITITLPVKKAISNSEEQ